MSEVLDFAQKHLRVRSDGVAIPGQSVLLRILWRCEETESGCWEWRGHCGAKEGYGRIRLDGSMHNVHRALYEQLFGYLPDDMVVCHTCDNPPCCNPDHLYLGTPADNMADRDGKGRRDETYFLPPQKRETCPQGHLYEGANLIINSRGNRVCRMCKRKSDRESQQRRAARKRAAIIEDAR